MPHRRLTALRLAVLPLAVTATLAGASGCEIAVSPSSSLPVPFSVAPTPSESAGVPAYVCTAAYKILTDGAVHLATYMTGTGEHATQGLRDTFTGMAKQFIDEAGRTPDAELQQALRRVGEELTLAANSPDPKGYVNGGFQDLGQSLDAACKDA